MVASAFPETVVPGHEVAAGLLDVFSQVEAGELDTALDRLGQLLCRPVELDPESIQSDLSRMAATLVITLNEDPQSPAFYRFLRKVEAGMAERIALVMSTLNFTAGAQNPEAVHFAVLIGFAGLVSAAGRHDDAIQVLSKLVIGQPHNLAISHALFVAKRRKAGRSDDLTGTFCRVPFERFDVLTGGAVHICCAAFMPQTAGNLYDRDWEGVWNGPEAQDIRTSIHDASYRYCDKLKCPKFETGLIDLAGSDAEILEVEVSAESVQAGDVDAPLSPLLLEAARIHATRLPIGPRMVNLAFDRSCNLACPSCRTDFIVAKSGERDAMLAMADEKVMPLLETAGLVVVTGSGDPFASKTFRHIMRSLGPERFPNLELKIMTNGVLFTPQEWEKIAHLHGTIQSVVVSIDAAEPDTYAVLRKGGDWDRLQTNLAFLGDLYQQGAFKEYGLAFVVQAANWRQIPAFIELGRRVKASVVRFSPIENWGTYDPAAFAAQAVQYPGHPDHAAFVALLNSEAARDPLANFGVLSSYVADAPQLAVS